MNEAKNKAEFVSNFTDAILMVSCDTSHTIDDIRKMNFGSLLALIDFLSRRAEEEKKRIDEVKSKSKNKGVKKK